jgi:hypothetical protein
MKYTEKQAEQRRQAVYKYDDKFFRVNCRLPQGTKERIMKQGYKSVNSFVAQAVLDRLDQLESRKI